MIFLSKVMRMLNNKLKLITPDLICSTANKSWSKVNYHQSLAFDGPYLSCNDHCDRWLFQEIFLSLFLFHISSFEQSWTCFLGIVKHPKDYVICKPTLQGTFIFSRRLCFLVVFLFVSFEWIWPRPKSRQKLCPAFGCCLFSWNIKKKLFFCKTFKKRFE